MWIFAAHQDAMRSVIKTENNPIKEKFNTCRRRSKDTSLSALFPLFYTLVLYTYTDSQGSPWPELWLVFQPHILIIFAPASWRNMMLIRPRGLFTTKVLLSLFLTHANTYMHTAHTMCPGDAAIPRMWLTVWRTVPQRNISFHRYNDA